MDIIYLCVLLVIYLLHVNKIIFFSLALCLITMLILQKKYKHVVLFIFIIYILSIYNLKLEKFKNNNKIEFFEASSQQTNSKPPDFSEYMGTYHSNNGNKYIINIDNWIIDNTKYNIFNKSLSTGGTYIHTNTKHNTELTDGNVILKNLSLNGYKQILFTYTNTERTKLKIWEYDSTDAETLKNTFIHKLNGDNFISIPNNTDNSNAYILTKNNTNLTSQSSNLTSQSTNLTSQSSNNSEIKLDCNDERCNIKINSIDYDEIQLVLNALLDEEYLEKYVADINGLLDDNSYCIKNIYDLSSKVLNVNNDVMYNNFLENITCKTENTIDYLNCDNDNYKRLHAFCELIMVYTFSTQFVIEIINKHNIYSLCDLNSNRNLLTYNITQSQIGFSGLNTSYGYEYDGLIYYLEEKTINDKYFEIMELMEYDKLLDNDYESNDKEQCNMYNNECIKLREKLYRYKHCNKKIAKDLNSIIILLNYYEVFDPIRINNENYYNNWEYNLLKSVNLNELYWNNNPYFVKYNLKATIIKYINKLTNKNLMKKNVEIKKTPKCSSAFKILDKIESKDDKNIGDDLCNNLKNIDLEVENNILDGKNIALNFSKTITDIINDLIILFNKKNDCSTNQTLLVYYINELVKILMIKGRMFYVGILVIIISLIFYFIDISN